MQFERAVCVEGSQRGAHQTDHFALGLGVLEVVCQLAFDRPSPQQRVTIALHLEEVRVEFTTSRTFPAHEMP